MRIKYTGFKNKIGILLPIGSGEAYESKVMVKKGEYIDLADDQAILLLRKNHNFVEVEVIEEAPKVVEAPKEEIKLEAPKKVKKAKKKSPKKGK